MGCRVFTSLVDPNQAFSLTERFNVSGRIT